ncbi:ribbon-helix-helix domain-containing protein [Gluconobacter cerinus]|uniref:ribbon-helix-helix domain-containing protein n=1 Tax=Gluconobacter cerinus TaxID=38307 RepID=UPI001B8B912C|nr:ribbon-helix-helix domain-containing protein [Gluconobacter cerinus]MBS0995908.1 hypothetical protein [Gluconobacter cerinus]
MSRKGSLLSLRDRDSAISPVVAASESKPVAPSRQGKKAMTGYFSPEMSFAMHMTARKHGMSLQDAMADAFNDWLRKMGESPVGK